MEAEPWSRPCWWLGHRGGPCLEPVVHRAGRPVSRRRSGPLPARRDDGTCEDLRGGGFVEAAVAACPQSARRAALGAGGVVGPVESPVRKRPVVTGTTPNTADSASAAGPVLWYPRLRSILRIAPASAGDGPGMLTSRACTRVSRDVPPGDTVAVPVITVRHGERVAVRRRHQAPSAPAPSRSPAPVRDRKRAEPRGRTQKKNPGTRPGAARPSPE